MNQHVVAVVNFHDGGDHIHWFPFVVIEVPPHQNLDALSYAIGQIERSEVLDEKENYDDTGAGAALILDALQKHGIDVVGVYDAAGRMDYLAYDE